MKAKLADDWRELVANRNRWEALRRLKEALGVIEQAGGIACDKDEVEVLEGIEVLTWMLEDRLKAIQESDAVAS